jgi:hypothetical protein
MAVQNFRLVSEFQTIHRRPFELAAPATLKPTDVRPMVDGEFLQLDTAYKMARGGDNTITTPPTPDSEGTVPAFAYFAERGRYETQAIQKGPFLYLGPYEADTMIMYGTGLSLGDKLSVFDIDIGGIVRRGLFKATAGGYVVGFVTRLPANNNNWLRFIRV